VQVSTSEDGKTIAGGSWLNDDNGLESGHSKVFNLVNDEWEQLGNTIVGESSYDYAGYLVSLSAGMYFHSFGLSFEEKILVQALILSALFRWSKTGRWGFRQRPSKWDQWGRDRLRSRSHFLSAREHVGSSGSRSRWRSTR